MAQHIVETLPSNPERTAGLRKLMEAKDCIVRCSLYRNVVNQRAEQQKQERTL
jgi:hypothetical protein